MKDIKRMQDNLKILRVSMGWTAAEMAEKLGVSRTSISNIENHVYSMDRLYFLAIHKIVEDELDSSVGFHELPSFILTYYIDDPSWFDSEEEEKDIRDIINSVVPKTGRKHKSNKFIINALFLEKMYEHGHTDFFED